MHRQAFRIMRNAGLSTPQKSRVMQHDDKLVELRRSGLTYIAIGGMLNMSHSNVRHRLRRLNATAKAKPFTEEETETLLDVYAHTGSWEGVHDHVVAMGKKHPRQRVENILRKQGATQRRKRHIDGEMVRLLVDRGANPSAVCSAADGESWTAIALAVAMNHGDVAGRSGLTR